MKKKDFSVIKVQYYVVFGRGDCSDTQEIEISLNEDEIKAYKKAYEEEIPLEDIEELKNVLNRAYLEACEIETDNLIYSGDPDAAEYVGRIDVTKEDLEARVHNKEKKALEFLELNDLSDEELEKWNADGLDEMPCLYEVDSNYDDINLFDELYTLKVYFTEEW